MDQKTVLKGLRLTVRQAKWLRFTAETEGLSESEVLRDMLRIKTHDAISKVANQYGIEEACKVFGFPESVASLPFNDISAMLDDERGGAFAQLTIDFSNKKANELYEELDYPVDHGEAIIETWD